MAIPAAAALVIEMLDTLDTDPKRGILAARRLNVLPGVQELWLEHGVRKLYGLDAKVAEGHDHKEAMRELGARRGKLLGARPVPGLSAFLDVETQINQAHALIDAVDQLAWQGVLDERALFPEKAAVRTHADVKREVAECTRSRRARWEEEVGARKMSPLERRDALREYYREGAAAEARGEGPLVVWRRERRAAMLGAA
ncbi:hypothetical protein Q8F55_006072 [Vanrija albida]|uniref:Uncharacterized protein n=1 Tax=Vanrija albida TaxID=181172 RepID=A0ABR3Q3C9_9TREE